MSARRRKMMQIGVLAIIGVSASLFAAQAHGWLTPVEQATANLTDASDARLTGMAQPTASVASSSNVAGSPTPGHTLTISQGALPSPSPALVQRILPVRVATALPQARSIVAPRLVEDPRVELALRKLTTDEDRVGQLLLLGWLGNTAEHAAPELSELRAGGIVYVDNVRTAREAATINLDLQRQVADAGLVPPLIAVDHEGGQVQRIVDVPNVGSNASFAVQGPTDREACLRGLDHAKVLLAMGFSMNLAPVLDVNNNPNNPVIGDRSYGSDPHLVSRLGSAYVRGLQGGGVAAVGKHFPGHGNTSVDSHLQLPILSQTLAELDRVELVPFRQAIADPVEIAGIMTAHIAFPTVDPSGAPATLSPPIVTGLLRQQMGYQGLVLSDDMGVMKAITDNFGPGEAAVRSIEAGVDMVIMAGGPAKQRLARDALLAALSSGRLSSERVDEALRHVLRVKARFGLLGGQPFGEARAPCD